MSQRPINQQLARQASVDPVAARQADNPQAVPAGLPAWVTTGFIDETMRVWQPRSKKALTQDDAIEIIMNMSRLLDVLLDKDAG